MPYAAAESFQLPKARYYGGAEARRTLHHFWKSRFRNCDYADSASIVFCRIFNTLKVSVGTGTAQHTSIVHFMKTVLCSVSDPHRFYADPDPDPTFLLNADADPDPDPTCRI
jgi:hypothetical protein